LDTSADVVAGILTGSGCGTVAVGKKDCGDQNNLRMRGFIYEKSRTGQKNVYFYTTTAIFLHSLNNWLI
jgi:hypothetical protein